MADGNTQLIWSSQGQLDLGDVNSWVSVHIVHEVPNILSWNDLLEIY